MRALRSEPRWLTPLEVEAINRKQVDATGEPFQVLNIGLLESACAKPCNHWHYGEDDIAVLASSLLFGIARNHPFAQGNKRTAFVTAALFLEANGFQLIAPDTQAFADRIVDVLQDAERESEFVDLLHRSIGELD